MRIERDDTFDVDGDIIEVNDFEERVMAVTDNGGPIRKMTIEYSVKDGSMAIGYDDYCTVDKFIEMVNDNGSD